MPSKLFELRVFKGPRPVPTPSRLLETLDWDDPESAKDLLRRHLIAVAERDCGDRGRAHLYHLDLHEIRHDRPEQDAWSTYAPPVEA